MAGKIPSNFIDDLIARVDIVDVVDRRVPLVRKGREYQACCPFHEEKTPSFTVSPSKQFYHCFGCGAHGTAIGFLMDYANLSFVEAIEELADSMGLEVPKEAGGRQRQDPNESPGQLLKIIEQASYWFGQQLRNHPEGKQAIEYLKRRGLDGKTAASFGVGYAPDSWNGLANALGSDEESRIRLEKAGLTAKREASDSNAYYDRFRGRVMFPIEDHRGRIVAFGGRIIGEGEPKYLNSPETSLFHKGAELYGLHRARRAIGQENRSIVVEGYMDVIGLAQYGVDYAVATLGTATTRTHLQRLFRLAPEIIFCFDGDRAGRDAAWKAMQIALNEMQDGRMLGFLFLPDGQDPDSWIRSQGKSEFERSLDQAKPLPEFMFDTLTQQVDMTRMEGRARLISLARPLIEKLPAGSLKEMMLNRLSSLSGLTEQQLDTPYQGPPTASEQRIRKHHSLPKGQLSTLALATSLLLQYPRLAQTFNAPSALDHIDLAGADVLHAMLRLLKAQPNQTTAQLLESFRSSEYHGYLERLAAKEHQVESNALGHYFQDTIDRLVDQQTEQIRLALLEKSRVQALNQQEKDQLLELLKSRATH